MFILLYFPLNLDAEKRKDKSNQKALVLKLMLMVLYGTEQFLLTLVLWCNTLHGVVKVHLMHMHNFQADLKKLMWLLMKDLELELKGREFWAQLMLVVAWLNQVAVNRSLQLLSLSQGLLLLFGT